MARPPSIPWRKKPGDPPFVGMGGPELTSAVAPNTVGAGQPVQTWTELDLFQAVGQESVEALEELAHRIERCVRWQLGSRGEEEVQEVCDRVRDKLEALRRRGFSGEPRAFRTYLFRVVASQVVEVKRDAARVVSLDTVIDLPGGGTQTLRDVAAQMVDRHGDIVEELGRREQGELVRQALAQLDDRCRRLLWQREVDGSAEREIGARLGLSVSNVGASLHRCRERLYRVLLATRAAGRDRDWEGAVSRLSDSLADPMRVVFGLWWTEHKPVRQISAQLGRSEHEVKDLLARAKAAVWRLAQETGTA